MNQTITDLVRGPLATGIKQMIEQVPAGVCVKMIIEIPETRMLLANVFSQKEYNDKNGKRFISYPQGLKSSSLLSGSLHPWQFIVDAANEVVETDYKSVFSRLVLCKTFK